MITKPNISRINSLFLSIPVLFLLLLLIPVSVSAQDFHVKDSILTKYDGPGGDVIISGDIKKIGVSAFQNNTSITSVSIPEGCFAVDDGAFDGCTNLKSVSLPSTLKTIGTLAFARCKSIEYIHLPSGLETISGGAFYNCDSLGSINFPSSVKTLEGSCCAGCDSLVLLTVDSSNKNYIAEDSILYTKDRKTLIQYPGGLVQESFTIPNGVEIIGPESFRGQTHLKEIVFSGTVRKIMQKSFNGCTSLTSVELPENIEKIYEYSFQNCTNLCRLYVRNDKQETMATAFNGDTSLILYGPEESKIHTHAKKYGLRFRPLADDTYDFPDSEMKF